MKEGSAIMKPLGLLLVALMLWSGPAGAAPSADAILAASDAIRNPGRPFSVTVTLTEFQAAVQIDTSTLISYSRTHQQGGSFPA